MYRASPLKPGAIAGSFTAETGVCVGDEGYYKFLCVSVSSLHYEMI